VSYDKHSYLAISVQLCPMFMIAQLAPFSPLQPLPTHTLSYSPHPAHVRTLFQLALSPPTVPSLFYLKDVQQ